MSLAGDLCQHGSDYASLPGEWVSNTDSGIVCQGDGTAPNPLTADQHGRVYLHQLLTIPLPYFIWRKELSEIQFVTSL